jgi:hypothetical protein
VLSPIDSSKPCCLPNHDLEPATSREIVWEKNYKVKKKKNQDPKRVGVCMAMHLLPNSSMIPCLFNRIIEQGKQNWKTAGASFYKFFFEIRASFYIRALPAISHHQTSPLVREELHHSSI